MTSITDIPTHASGEVLLDAVGVNVSYGGKTILNSVDLKVRKGEIVTLVGLNGSGKSTLVKVLIGLIKPDTGKIYQRQGLRIGYSPQTVNADPVLPLSVKRFLTLGTQARDVRVKAVLEEVGAAGIADSQIAQISGGEMHRVLLARALLRKPDLLVLDEPLAGVDVSGQSDIYRLIADIRDLYDCGVLLVSHDLHLVMAATDTVACLNHHICCTGHPESVASHPEFVSLFGRHVAEVLAVYTHHHDHTHDAAGDIIPLTGTRNRESEPMPLYNRDG